MIPLTGNENKFYEQQEKCHTCQKKFCCDKNEKNKFKIYQKFIYYKVPIETPVKIHNGSTYDYHFIFKELAEEFKGQFGCLGENTEKYITFSVLIKKEHDNDKTITYKIKFTDSCRFM